MNMFYKEKKGRHFFHLLYVLSWCVAVFCISSCTSEVVNFEDTSEAGRIKLGIDNLNDVAMTYSTATTSENRINDCVLLVYRGGSCAAAEQIDINDIVNNGFTSPILPPTTTKLQNGDKLYVICNTAVAAVQCAESAINTTYTTQRTYKGGDAMPFVAVIDNYTTANNFALATRAVAKIQVKMGTSIPDNTATFTLQNVTWNAVNYGTTASTILPTTTNTPSTSATTDNFRLLQTEGATETQTTLYLPEYSSSTGGAANDTDFDADRQCILLKKSANGTDTYYRLDFYNRSTKKFIDTKRNCHYIFTINKVMREGYRTAAEALANPGSNIEYTVNIEDKGQNYIYSDGQYALSMSTDTIRKINTVFNFRVQIPPEVNPTAIQTHFFEIFDKYGNNVGMAGESLEVAADGTTITSHTPQFSANNVMTALTFTANDYDGLDSAHLILHLGNITTSVFISLAEWIYMPDPGFRKYCDLKGFIGAVNPEDNRYVRLSAAGKAAESINMQRTTPGVSYGGGSICIGCGSGNLSDINTTLYDVVKDLTGIEAFKNLKALYVSGNNIDSINLSKNTTLEEIATAGNPIRKIYMKSNPNLKIAYIGMTTNIDTVDISYCSPNFEFIYATTTNYVHTAAQHPSMVLSYLNNIIVPSPYSGILREENIREEIIELKNGYKLHIRATEISGDISKLIDN